MPSRPSQTPPPQQSHTGGDWLPEAEAAYAARVATEKEIYKHCLDVHDLPPIFHYWSNRYVRPKLERYGISSPEHMFQKYVAKQFQTGAGTRRIASLGAGNCQLEVDIAQRLVRQGHENFTIDCLELNPAMLERGQEAALEAGVAGHLRFLPTDLNTWRPGDEYDALIANQILHHVLNLEGLFAEIKRSLRPGGSFIVSDMIGRNGHLRWPEALSVVKEFWRKLPPSYRFNPQLRRYEETYLDWDCSGESFEGIRSQDILPLLVDRFDFEFFFAFANIVSPFVDRSFGVHFDPTRAWDREFIDAVHARDEQEIAALRIPPTHLLAVLGGDSGVPPVVYPHPPQDCLRRRSQVFLNGSADLEEAAAYEWGAWPHSDRSELEIACRRLQQAEERSSQAAITISERTAWAERLTRELESASGTIRALQTEVAERNAWALRLDAEVSATAAQIQELQQIVKERTDWALRLDKERTELLNELKARIAREQQLALEVEARGAHILLLDREVAEKTQAHQNDLERLAWAAPFDRRLHRTLAWAVTFAMRTHLAVRRIFRVG